MVTKYKRTVDNQNYNISILYTDIISLYEFLQVRLRIIELINL